MDDGRWRHLIRQSWLGSFEKCPEQARLKLTGELPERLTDSLLGGQVIHATIEYGLGEHLAGQPPSLDELFGVYDRTFDDELAKAGGNAAVQWEKRQERGTRTYGRRSIKTWYEFIYPELTPVAVEYDFGPITLYEDDRRIIDVRGVIDYADVGGLWDWKSTSRSDGFDLWEKQRWDVQATLYTWAAALVLPDIPHNDFTFCVFLPSGEAQLVTVTRDEGDWAWITEKVLSIVALIEAEIPVWPKNDSGWWCGSKWCPEFAEGRCKGAHVGHDAW